jgi:hypothetical protein
MGSLTVWGGSLPDLKDPLAVEDIPVPRKLFTKCLTIPPPYPPKKF